MTKEAFARNPFLFLIFTLPDLHDLLLLCELIILGLIDFLPPRLLFLLLRQLLLLLLLGVGGLSLLLQRGEQLVDLFLIGGGLVLRIVYHIPEVIPHPIGFWLLVHNELGEIATIIKAKVGLSMIPHILVLLLHVL